jgi:hypothetical protein
VRDKAERVSRKHLAVVCTKNSILIDYVTESPNVSGDDRSVMLLGDSVRHRLSSRRADLRQRTWLAPSSTWALCPSSVAFIITIAESSFRYTQPACEAPVCIESFIRFDCVRESHNVGDYVALLCLFLALLASPFKSNSRLEAENAALRHQLMVLQRKVRGRVQFTNGDRLFFIQLYRWFPSVLRSSGQRPLCAGIALGFVTTGAGNPAPREAGRKSMRNCER